MEKFVFWVAAICAFLWVVISISDAEKQNKSIIKCLLSTQHTCE